MMTPRKSPPRRRTATPRSGRLGLRTTSVQAALIQRAAEVAQKSITEFVLTSACEKAEQTLLDHRLFLVDDEAWKLFQEVLERPARVIPELENLIETPAIWEHD